MSLEDSIRAFAVVHMVRVMAADHGMSVTEAFTDHDGRPIVDCLPDFASAWSLDVAEAA